MFFIHASFFDILIQQKVGQVGLSETLMRDCVLPKFFQLNCFYCSLVPNVKHRKSRLPASGFPLHDKGNSVDRKSASCYFWGMSVYFRPLQTREIGLPFSHVFGVRVRHSGSSACAWWFPFASRFRAVSANSAAPR